jgi:serine/threonine-protein kinase SRPK3
MEIIKKLGAGAFSKVYYVKLENGSYGAMKKPRKHVESEDAIRDSNNEVEFLKHFTNSAYVINMLEYKVDADTNRIVLEPLGEELEYVIKHYRQYNTTIPLRVTKYLSKQILYGLSEMSSIDILHNDLKPENVLFTTHLPQIFHTGKRDWFRKVFQMIPKLNKDHLLYFNDVLKEMALMRMRVKIIDFGNAFSKKTMRTNKDQFLDSRPTRYYISPEILLDAPFWTKSDMWGFGCIVYEMVTGTTLFNPRRDNEIGINNMHLCLINMTIGRFPKSLLKTGKHSKKYFINGIHRHRYLIYRTSIRSVISHYIHNPIDLKTTLHFLSSIFVINPKLRISAFECLLSDWFNIN